MEFSNLRYLFGSKSN